MVQLNLFDLPSIPSMRSPLGYPGGKRRLWPYLEPYLPSDLELLVSPFIGGGAIELACTGKGIRIEGYDNFEPLTNFWNHFIQNSENLIDLVIEMYPLTFDLKLYYHNTQLKKGSFDPHGNPLTDQQRAAIYFCINKQSFRGWGLARPPSRCEELKPISFFDKYKIWQNEYIKVKHSDYVPVIENSNGAFMYCDPPYVEKEYFYGAYENKSTFDHENLSRLLHDTDSKWILSYGDHPLIRELYKGYTIIEPTWKYVVRRSNDTKSEELLILNL